MYNFNITSTNKTFFFNLKNKKSELRPKARIITVLYSCVRNRTMGLSNARNIFVSVRLHKQVTKSFDIVGTLRVREHYGENKSEIRIKIFYENYHFL